MHDIRAPQALVHCRPTADRVCCAAGLTRRCGGRAQAAQRWHHRLTGASIDRTDGCLGPFMRRLTPQVVGQAGRPHRHLSGPAAHQGVNAASKGAHAHSPRPAHRPTPARTPPVSRGCRFESCRRPSPAHSPTPACIRRPTPARIRRPTHIRSHTRTSGNTKTPEPEAVPGSGGGGWGILRTLLISQGKVAITYRLSYYFRTFEKLISSVVLDPQHWRGHRESRLGWALTTPTPWRGGCELATWGSDPRPSGSLHRSVIARKVGGMSGQFQNGYPSTPMPAHPHAGPHTRH